MHMCTRIVVLLGCLVGLAFGQKAGSQKENVHLPLQIEECTGSENCKVGMLHLDQKI